MEMINGINRWNSNDRAPDLALGNFDENRGIRPSYLR